MTPELQQVVNEAMAVAFRSALAAGGVGLVVGLALGVAVHLGFSVAGVYRGEHRLARLGRVVAALWTVGACAVLVGLAAAAGGAYAGAGPALLESELGPKFFRPTGELAADVGVKVIALAPDLVGVAAPPGAPALDDAVLAVRQGRWEIPVEHVHRVADAYDAALRGPQGETLARELTDLAIEGLPPKPADLARGALIRVTNAIRRGQGPAGVDTALADAWRGLDAASAADGRPGTLSHPDLVKLAIDGVVLPIGLRPFLGVAVPVVAVALALLVPACGLPALIAWLARRLVRANPIAPA